MRNRKPLDVRRLLEALNGALRLWGWQGELLRSAIRHVQGKPVSGHPASRPTGRTLPRRKPK